MTYVNVLSGLAVAVLAAAVGAVTVRVAPRLDPTWNPVALPSILCAVWTVGWALGEGVAFALVGWWCSCLSSIDVGCRRLPNRLTGAGSVVVLGYGVSIGQASIVCAGAGGLFCAYLVIHLAAPRALGAGDVKLSVALGGLAALAGGIESWSFAAVCAPLLTGLLGLAALALGRGGARLPHGPSMCLSTLLVVAAGPS